MLNRSDHNPSAGVLSYPPGFTPNDNQLIRDFFRAFHGRQFEVISAATMLLKTKDSYPLPWAIREIAQNMADHNPPPNKHTINGVEIIPRQLKDGLTETSVVGHWNFADITGALLNHSKKDGDGMEGEELDVEALSAGGNGVGLKQAAIRFVRDFDAEFEIHGGDQAAGWIVSYQIIKKDAFNRMLKEAGLDFQIKRDYFVAEQKAAPPTNCCKYIFTTKNNDVTDSLARMNEVAVCADNPFLKNPDFSGKHGAIKWINPGPDETEPQEGRLFVTGQVYGYKQKGASDANYWRGPEGVTVQLNTAKVAKTMDRPPLSATELAMAIGEIVWEMSPQAAMGQLHKSESIWTKATPKGSFDSDRPGWQVVVERLISRIKISAEDLEPSLEEVQQGWKDKKYIAVTSNLSDEQTKELLAKGYTLCPKAFHELGMADARSALDRAETVRRVPRVAHAAMEKLFKESGAVVVTDALEEVHNPKKLFAWFKRELASFIKDIEINEGGRVRISMKGLRLEEGEHSSILYNPSSPEQKALFAIRSFIQKGLSSGYPSWFKGDEENVPTSFIAGVQTTYASQFLSGGPQLAILNSPVNGDECCLEFSLGDDIQKHAVEFQSVPPLAHQIDNQTIVVAADQVSGVYDFNALTNWLKIQLRSQIGTIRLEPNGMLFIDLPGLHVDADQSAAKISRPKTSDERGLFSIRSFLFEGMRTGWIDMSSPPCVVCEGVRARYFLLAGKVDPELPLKIEIDEEKVIGSYVSLYLTGAGFNSVKDLLKEGHADTKKEEKVKASAWKRITAISSAAVLAVTAAVTLFTSREKDGGSTGAKSDNSGRERDKNALVLKGSGQSQDDTKKPISSNPIDDARLPNLQDIGNQSAERSKGLIRAEEILRLQLEEAGLQLDNSNARSPGAIYEQYIKRKSEGDLPKPFDRGRKLDIVVQEELDSVKLPHKTEADTSPKDPKLAEISRLTNAIQEKLKGFAPNGHVIEDFRIVESPTSDQLRKLNLLAEYVHLTTGVAINSDLFTYEGKGAYGVNIGKKAIGLHHTLVDPLAPWGLAHSTMIHEVAHNALGQGHEPEWQLSLSTLYARSLDTYNGIVSKFSNGQKLTKDEQRILEIRDSWYRGR